MGIGFSIGPAVGALVKVSFCCTVFTGLTSWSEGSEAASRSSRNMLVLILCSSISFDDLALAVSEDSSISALRRLAGTVAVPLLPKS